MTLLLDYFEKNLEVFPLSPSFEIPNSLRQILDKAWQNRYEEFCEENPTKNITLEETLSNILDTIE